MQCMVQGGEPAPQPMPRFPRASRDASSAECKLIGAKVGYCLERRSLGLRAPFKEDSSAHSCISPPKLTENVFPNIRVRSFSPSTSRLIRRPIPDAVSNNLGLDVMCSLLNCETLRRGRLSAPPASETRALFPILQSGDGILCS